MIDYLLLALAILLATIIWPILRLGLKNGARTEQLGIITSMVAVFFIIILGLILQIPIYEQKASLIGIIAGSAYAIGFYYVTIHCLKIGPTGPTVTITNLGLIWPVLISITFFNQNFDSIILLGLIASILGIILMGWNDTKQKENQTINSRWFRWALVNWIFAGIIMSSQLFSSRNAPSGFLAFQLSMNLVALIFLIIKIIIKKEKYSFKKIEVHTGILLGIIKVCTGSLGLFLLTRLPATIAFPIMTVAPAVFILILGHFTFGEKLNRAGWSASFFGLVGIILLASAST